MDNSDLKCTAILRNGTYEIRDLSAGERGSQHETSEYSTLSLTTKIEVVGTKLKKYKPVLILAIDVSGSMVMNDNLEKVKRCLLYMYKNLKSKSNGEIKDIMDLHLITFSTTARLVWSTAFCSDDSFCSTVKELKTESSTNIYEALMLARQLMLRKAPTWFVLLTDGRATAGPDEKNPYTYSNFFKSFPDHVDTIAVGVGEDYSENILSCAESVLHADSAEELDKVLAYLYVDMFNLVGYAGKFLFPSWISSNVKVLVGDNKIGFLPRGRLIRNIMLPNGNCICKDCCNDIEGLKLDPVLLSYIDVTGECKMVRIPVTCSNSDLDDDDVEAYYETMTSKFIKDLTSSECNKVMLSNTILIETSLWRRGLSDKYRQRIRLAASDMLQDKINKLRAMSIAKSRISQRSFNPGDGYICPVYSQRYQQYSVSMSDS